MEFGEKIRMLREQAGLNQTQMGSKLGMTQRKLSYIECGKYEPGLDDIRVLCRYFGVSADYLLGLSNKRKRDRE